MKSIFEYIKDVKWFIKKYGSKDWYKKESKYIFLRNALYCMAPGRWVRYNKLIDVLFDFFKKE